MSSKPILIVTGEPNSIFLEIFFKSIKYYKCKNPLILISSYDLIRKQMKKFKFKKNIKKIKLKDLSTLKLDNNFINLIDVKYKSSRAFEKISSKSNSYIKKSFSIAFKLIKSGFTYKLLNGPISKKHFLKKQHLGITEFIAKNFSVKNSAMLIYNKKLSVCPITTHLPLKRVTKKINKKLITEKIYLINNFYNSFFRKKPKIGVLGVNPHCETIDGFNEDLKILTPTIKKLKKLKYKVSGPFPADTIFLKNNRKKFDVIVGMYHDQVLTPIKTLFEYDAINITLGLPFIRVSPDHGPNEKMIGKNISNPLSLIQALKFLDRN